MSDGEGGVDLHLVLDEAGVLRGLAVGVPGREYVGIVARGLDNAHGRDENLEGARGQIDVPEDGKRGGTAIERVADVSGHLPIDKESDARLLAEAEHQRPRLDAYVGIDGADVCRDPHAVGAVDDQWNSWRDLNTEAPRLAVAETNRRTRGVVVLEYQRRILEEGDVETVSSVEGNLSDGTIVARDV